MSIGRKRTYGKNLNYLHEEDSSHRSSSQSPRVSPRAIGARLLGFGAWWARASLWRLAHHTTRQGDTNSTARGFQPSASFTLQVCVNGGEMLRAHVVESGHASGQRTTPGVARCGAGVWRSDTAVFACTLRDCNANIHWMRQNFPQVKSGAFHMSLHRAGPLCYNHKPGRLGNLEPCWSEWEAALLVSLENQKKTLCTRNLVHSFIDIEQMATIGPEQIFTEISVQ